MMALSSEGHISVTRIAAAYKTSSVAALTELTESEADVLTVLTAHRASVDGLPGVVAGVLQTFGRRRKTRRALARLSGDARRTYAAMRPRVDSIIGRTKPFDPLSTLCAELSKHCGLTATETALLLHETGIELCGAHVEAGRDRVRHRVRRARRNLGPHG